MKLINAEKIMEKLETQLYNPEEFPVMGLGDIKRMIDKEPEALDLQKLREAFDAKASVFANAEEEARKKGDTLAEMLFDMLKKHAESYWWLVIDCMNKE